MPSRCWDAALSNPTKLWKSAAGSHGVNGAQEASEGEGRSQEHWGSYRAYEKAPASFPFHKVITELSPLWVSNEKLCEERGCGLKRHPGSIG